MLPAERQKAIGGDGLNWEAMGPTGDNLPYSAIEPEVVRDSGDSANEVHDIDVNQYARTSQPKGYVRVAEVGENPNPTGRD